MSSYGPNVTDCTRVASKLSDNSYVSSLKENVYVNDNANIITTL